MVSVSDGWNDSWEQNHSVPGVVYVLRNPFLRDGFYKIGCTRTSGWVRARELDDAAKGAIPKGFECVYEKRSVDCGRAEQRTFQKLHEHRRGQHFMDGERFAGQEFFEIPLERAIRAIEEACAEIQTEYDAEQVRLKAEREERWRREAAEREARAEERGMDRLNAAEADTEADEDEQKQQSSYVYSWNKPKGGPSTGAVLAWTCAVVFVGVFLLNSRKQAQVPRVVQASPQVSNSARVPLDRYNGPPTQADGRVGEPMFVVPKMPSVTSSTVPFPPAGSALYFAGKPEGTHRLRRSGSTCLRQHKGGMPCWSCGCPRTKCMHKPTWSRTTWWRWRCLQEGSGWATARATTGSAPS